MFSQQISKTIVGLTTLIPLISIVFHAYSAEWQPIILSDEEKERIRQETEKGTITVQNVPMIFQRIVDTPPWVEDRIGYALKSGAGPGFMRELGSIVETLQDPDIMFKNTQRQFEEYGIIHLFGIILLMPLLLPIDISIVLTY